MIRINLLKNSGGGGGQATASTTSVHGLTITHSSVDIMPNEGIDVFLKLISLLLLPAMLIGYQYYHLHDLNLQVSQIKQSLQQKKQEAAQYGPKLQEVKKMQEERKRLQAQVDTIRKLSRERLQGTKSLDALQDLIPEKTWLTALKFEGKKVEMQGYTIDDLDISTFMKSMEDSIYFANVRLVNSREVRSERGIFKQFKISCMLENI